LAVAQSTKHPLFSTINLEREIEERFRNRPPVREVQPADFAPLTVHAPALSMPDYVEHPDGATELGKLSAEGAVREYESAAREIEALGVKLIERVKQSEAMVRDALAVSDDAATRTATRVSGRAAHTARPDETRPIRALRPPKRFADHNLAGRINTVDLKNVLGQVEADRGNLHSGWLPFSS
jgi:hypothetical protein